MLLVHRSATGETTLSSGPKPPTKQLKKKVQTTVNPVLQNINGKKKQTPCVFFQRGYCKYGNDCPYTHSPAQQQQAPPQKEQLKVTNTVLQSNIKPTSQKKRKKEQASQPPVQVAKPPIAIPNPLGKQQNNSAKSTKKQQANPKKRARISPSITPPGESKDILMSRAARFNGTTSNASSLELPKPIQALPANIIFQAKPEVVGRLPEIFGNYSWDRTYGLANSVDSTHDYSLCLEEATPSAAGGSWILYESITPNFGRPSKRSIQGRFEITSRCTEDNTVRWLKFTKLMESSYDDGNVTQSHVEPQVIEVPFQVTADAVGILVSAFGRDKMLLKKNKII